LAVLTNGDTSGKAKLNQDQANPESARFFREAQTHRKKRMQYYIQFMYELMYATEHVQAYLARETGRTEKERSAMMSFGKVRVEIPVQPRIEDLYMYWEKGVLKWSAFAQMLAGILGLSLHSFPKTPKLTLQELNGVVEEKEEDDVSPPKKKKAKKQ
jgi:hypothetical protein